MRPSDILSIGDLARRTGIAVSAIRYYEDRGIISPLRSPGGQRRFRRSDIRRLSFIRIAQQMGLTIEQISTELSQLPQSRTPNAADWARISRSIREVLDQRIAALQRTRNLLDGCIGCGCLSMKKCALYNPLDRVAATGSGPRFVLEDRAAVDAMLALKP